MNKPNKPKTIRRHVAGCLVAVSGVLFCPVSQAQGESSQSDLHRLAGITTLAGIIQTLGRPSDLSDAGGACGGIVIHDWIAENVRVVALGEMVDSVTAIR